MPWFSDEYSDKDAARDSKNATAEERVEDSERETDWTRPSAAWFMVEERERDADNDAKRANSELRDEDSDNDADSVIPAIV